MDTSYAYGNYPGDIGQRYTPNSEGLRKIRDQFDPKKLSFNPLVDGPVGGTGSRCSINSRATGPAKVDSPPAKATQ